MLLKTFHCSHSNSEMRLILQEMYDFSSLILTNDSQSGFLQMQDQHLLRTIGNAVFSTLLEIFWIRTLGMGASKLCFNKHGDVNACLSWEPLNWLIGPPGGSDGKESTCDAGDLGSIPGLGRSTRGGMTTHSSILAWRITWTEEPGGLQSTGLQRVGHDWATTLPYAEYWARY